jgi:hypothetical protein
MALQDMPLSDLQSAVSLNGADLFYVVQSGESKKVTLAVMIGNKADLENGLVPLRELPNSVVMVANDTERFALDSDEVNNGFIVLQYDSTHPEISAKMFLVIDNTNLDSEAGYQPFAADAIWGNIINRPTNLAYLAGDDEELPSVSPVLRESNLQNNLVTTLPNYPLDARQGKVLDDKITAVNQSLTKYRSIEYTALANSDSSAYYIVLDNNVKPTLGATEVCTAMIVEWTNLRTVLGINIIDGKVYLTFPLGHTFSGSKVTIKYGYR